VELLEWSVEVFGPPTLFLHNNFWLLLSREVRPAARTACGEPESNPERSGTQPVYEIEENGIDESAIHGVPPRRKNKQEDGSSRNSRARSAMGVFPEFTSAEFRPIFHDFFVCWPYISFLRGKKSPFPGTGLHGEVCFETSPSSIRFWSCPAFQAVWTIHFRGEELLKTRPAGAAAFFPALAVGLASTIAFGAAIFFFSMATRPKEMGHRFDFTKTWG